MKRFISVLLICLATISLSAQTSFDIRVGAGLGGIKNDPDWGSSQYKNPLSVGLLLQPNITLKKGLNWTFSPSLRGTFYQYEDNRAITANINTMFGYRVQMGNQKFFSPKLGPFVGLECQQGGLPGSILAGVATDLSFELKHFVVGVDGYYSIKDVSGMGHTYSANVTLGVKIYNSGRPKKVKVSSPKSSGSRTSAKVKSDDNIYTLIGRAESYLHQYKYRKAASCYKKAAKLQPEGYGGSEKYNEGICLYNCGAYARALKCFYECSECHDLSADAHEELPRLISDAKQLLQERAERQAQIAAAIAMGVAQASQNISQSIANNNARTTVAPTRTTYVPTQRTATASRGQVDDDEEEKDIDIKDIKIKCHECGGSGKCRPSGTVEARTTRCGGSGKCPMCNGKGRTHTKCPKCKGEGCSKCDDTGYTECTGCDGSGECDHCGGSGKCPRCNGTGKE